MVAISTARHLWAEKTYKVKYKALKELEKDTPHKEVAALFGVPKNTLSSWEKKQGGDFPNELK